MKINKYLTKYNHNVGTEDRIKYIVIHYTGAVGSAQNNCKYFAQCDRGASAHYFVDYDGSVWQSVEDKNIAWHCKNTNPTCNNKNSIGIEMCVRNAGSKSNESKDWYFEDATVNATIELTRELMAKYNIPAENVWRHYDVTGKLCPNPYVFNNTKHTWSDFKASIVHTHKYAPNTWYQDDLGWWYATSEDMYAKGEWLFINKHRYYFNDLGYAVTGQQTIDGANYYFATDRESKDYECALMSVTEFS